MQYKSTAFICRYSDSLFRETTGFLQSGHCSRVSKDTGTLWLQRCVQVKRLYTPVCTLLHIPTGKCMNCNKEHSSSYPLCLFPEGVPTVFFLQRQLQLWVEQTPRALNASDVSRAIRKNFAMLLAAI